MAKKQESKKLVLPSWVKGAGISIIILPILAFSWRNIQDIWAAPKEVSNIKKQVDEQDDVQEQLSKLVVEQQARMDKNEAVYAAQLESTKEQLQLIAELKKSKK